MNLTVEQIEKMCQDIVEEMGLDDLISYVYDDLVYLNLRDNEVAVENWADRYGEYPE